MKFANSFKKIDAFGQGINFSVNGGDTFGTTFGTVLTLIIYGIILVYAQMKGQKLYHRLDTNHQATTNVDAIGSEDKFSFQELEANFAFGLWHNNFSAPLNLSTIEDYV